MRRKAREYALQVLFALDLNPGPAKDFLKTFWEVHPARDEVREYANTLVTGTLQKKKEIDELISAHSSNWKLDRMAVTDRNILRLGTYELMEERSVPAKVVMNEAIEIARRFGTSDSSLFVNGILDSIHQELEKSEKAGHTL